MELVRKQTDGSFVGRHGKQVASCVATEPEASVSHCRLHFSASIFQLLFRTILAIGVQKVCTVS